MIYKFIERNQMAERGSDDWREDRRKAAISFLRNVPVDFKSFCESCRGKRPRSSRTSEPFTNEEASNDISFEALSDSNASKALQARNVIGRAGKAKFLKASFQISLLKPRVMLQKRIFFVDKTGDIPISVVSVIGYQREGKLLTSSTTNISIKRRSKLTSSSQGATKILESQDAVRIDGIQMPGEEEVVSYKSLLDSSSRNIIQLQSFSELDNPEWKSGSHRTVLTFSSYIVSVLDYAKPAELKKDLNNRFKEKYPKVNITLSKCRSLKEDIQRIALSQNIDHTAMSKSLLYFDYLVMSGKVVKANRRYCAGVCLLLSTKVNSDLKTFEVSKLITAIEHGLRIGRHDLVLFEFPVLAALQFSLISFPSTRLVQYTYQ